MVDIFKAERSSQIVDDGMMIAVCSQKSKEGCGAGKRDVEEEELR